MRSRWFHPPELHTELHGHKRVSWLELLYDLIFVAGLIQVGGALSDGVAQGRASSTAVAFAGHLAAMWLAWTGFTFFQNRFDVDDFIHRIAVFVQMFAVGGMAVTAPMSMAAVGVGPSAASEPFAVATAVAHGLIALGYMRAYWQVPVARRYARYWGGVFAIATGLWMGSVLVPTPFRYAVWTLAVLVVLATPVSASSRDLTEAFPLDLDHLSRRYAFLTIVVLGESFVSVLTAMSREAASVDASQVARAVVNLTITCALWWVYFDDVAGSKIKGGRGTWVVWLYGHLPMGIAITSVGVAVKRSIALPLDVPAPPADAFLLAGTLAVALFSVAIIDSVTERRDAQLSDRTRVGVRAFSALVMLVLGQVGTRVSTGTFLGLLCALMLAQVLFDMLMAPLEATEHETASRRDWQEAASERAAAAAEAPDQAERPPDISTAVRRGAPTELRRDAYFFLLEGSWTRFLLSLTFVYLMLNVLFAGLYLLEPASIGADSGTAFATAFAFSVQTMSTIGYGAIHPLTPYGDLIVTIEAAVGMLAVAFATGLMFAKASRPRSSVLFSRPLVLTRVNGQRTLMFRVGNARGNEVVEANINVTALIDEVAPEGHNLRRLIDLELVRSRTPVFTLSWSVMHTVDETSPFADIHTREDLARIRAVIVTMMGHDATYGEMTHSRHIYYPPLDLALDHRFVDVISQLPDGRLLVDYHDFHRIVPDPPTAVGGPDDAKRKKSVSNHDHPDP